MKKLISLAALVAMATGLATAQDEVTKVAIGIDKANPMAYDTNEFEVPAGAKVELTFNNNGPLPKIAGGHNIVLLKKGVTALAFAPGAGPQSMAVAQKGEGEYLTDAQKEQVIAWTGILGPGDTEVMKFTAPAEAGVYEYVCTFPGHFATMKGKMTVK